MSVQLIRNKASLGTKNNASNPRKDNSVSRICLVVTVPRGQEMAKLFVQLK